MRWEMRGVLSLVLGAWLGGMPGYVMAQSGWTVLNSGTSNDLAAVHFVNPDTGYVAGAAGTILRTTNGGTSWQDVSPTGVSAALNGVHTFSEMPNRVVAVGDGGLALLTTNGGVTWSTIASGVSDDLLSVSFVSGIGSSGGRSQTILRSSDAGSSWNVVQSGFFGGGFFGAHMLSPSIGMVVGENSIFQPLLGKTTNGGANWTFIPFYLDSNEGRGYGVNFTDDTFGYVAASVWDGRGAIARTTNGGTAWTSTFFPGALYAITFPISATGLTGYAVGASGRVVKTTNAGNNWHEQTSGTAATLSGVCFLDLLNGYVVGDGGVILKTTTGGEPTIGVDDGENEIPHSFALWQNYPNPFNPSTALRFSLEEQSHVVLAIYDLSGQLVRTIVNESREAGTHNMQWDGTGEAGQDVASGVYIVRLDVRGAGQGQSSAVRKMTLLR